jgi:hypothetical protein
MAATAVLVASVLLLTGCLAPQPEPSPTPTAVFSSEEEAFAAAEETYRAYVEAANTVDLSVPATFEPMFALTTGRLSAEARKTFSSMHADGWVVEGETRVVLAEPLDISRDRREVVLAVCQDVSDVTVVDSTGMSVVASDRPDVQSMEATLVHHPSGPAGYLVAEIDGRAGEPLCDG